MQALSLKDAGIAQGGSLKLALRVADRFKSVGGTLKLNTGVKEIVVENDKACGVILENGERVDADYVISATDVHYTLNNMLNNKYAKEFYTKRFNDREKNPLSLGILVSYKVTKDMTNEPKMIEFPIEPFNIGKTVVKELNPRNHAFDPTLNKGCSTITVLIRVGDDLYDLYKSMSKEEYLAEKNRIGNIIRDNLMKFYNLKDDEIKFIDLATPITYERYCNSYRGSYQSFVTTGSHEKLMDNGLIPGLKNFVIAGQWVMPPGGLPIALFTGRHAAYRITRWEKRKFKA